MSSCRPSLLPLLFLMAVLAGRLAPVHGQNELRDTDRAAIAFDLRTDRLFESLTEMGIDLEKLGTPLQSGPPMLRGVKLSSLTRIYGAFGLPNSFDSLEEPIGNEPPFQFFVRVKFDSPEAAEQLMAQLSKTGKEVEINGDTFQVENADRPMALMAHMSDMTEVEMGTGRFLLHPNRKLMSEPLNSVWQTVPDHALRLAIELDTCKEVLDQAVANGASSLPPGVAPFLELANNVQSLVISSDLTAGQLLNVTLTGRDAAQAEELEQGLQGLVLLVKNGSQDAIEELTADLDNAEAPLTDIVKSLSVQRTDERITINIPVPDGFAGMIKGSYEQLANASEKAAARESDAIRMNRFRQAALSAHNYLAAYSVFPFVPQKQQNPKLSWQVKVLPYMEELELSRKFDLSKGPDEAPNADLADQMPEVLGTGGQRTEIVWIESSVTRIAEIMDGTSNTIMLIEYPGGLPWLNENKISPAKAIELVQGLEDGEKLVVALYDGSCRMISNEVDLETLERLFDPRDGEIIEGDF